MQNHFDSQVCLCDWLKVQNQFFSGGVFQVLGFLFYRLSFHQYNFRFILSSLSRHQVFRLKFRSTLVLKGCVGFFFVVVEPVETRCHFLAKSGYPKLSFWSVCILIWQVSFLSQAFSFTIAFGYLAFWQVLIFSLCQNQSSV